MKNKVSMQDIADSIGVSKVTVSKVLRGQSDVSEATSQKILKTAMDLDYVYKGNQKGKTDISKVTVLTPEHFFGGNDSFYVKLYKYLSEELNKLNIDVMLTILDWQSEKEIMIPDKLKNKLVDGVIVMGQFSREFLKSLTALKLPLIFLDFYYDDFDIPSINTDNFFGAYELTNALIKYGHKKIGFVGNYDFTSSIQDRFLGYYKSLIEHHLPLSQNWILDDRTEDGRYIDLRLPDELPTAFVCNCDEVAFTLINKLKSNGFRVPEDISVTGFDDFIYSDVPDSTITTVHVNLEEMAHAAVKAIVKKANNSTVNNSRILIRGKIIFRQSVARPNDGRI